MPYGLLVTLPKDVLKSMVGNVTKRRLARKGQHAWPPAPAVSATTVKGHSMTTVDADVIVVGLGAMGSAALWRLAERGTDVMGIERFSLGHDQGSSHGATRLFRTACLEHPGLVPLARRSLQLWRELEDRTSTTLLELSGGLMIGPEQGRVVSGTLAAARAHGLDVRVLPARELARRYPQHADVPADYVAVHDPQAGVVRPEAGVLAACQAAQAAGATIFADTRVLAVDLAGDGVVVITPVRQFRARQALVTAGPWLGKLVPALPLEPIRTPMTWFRPRAEDGAYDLGRFPTFIREMPDGAVLWGHGATAGHEVKAGPDDDGANFAPADPDTIDRGVSEADWAQVSKLVAAALPGLDPTPSRTMTCMVTRSPDHQFQLGRPYHDPRLVVGGGCSGHAFKHATGIGEALAQITRGEAPFLDLRFTDPNRFL
jgi:sarcosine oxidase